MSKPINLRKAIERKGIRALNILVRCGKVVKYDMYMTIQRARENAKEGCETYSVEQAVKMFPQYFIIA